MGHAPSTVGTFRKKFRKNSGKTPETLSEFFLEFPSRVRLGSPKPYNSRRLKAPEHFQNSLPPQVRLGTFFFRSGSGEGLSEPVIEFPAVLGYFCFLGQKKHHVTMLPADQKQRKASFMCHLSSSPHRGIALAIMPASSVAEDFCNECANHSENASQPC